MALVREAPRPVGSRGDLSGHGPKGEIRGGPRQHHHLQLGASCQRQRRSVSGPERRSGLHHCQRAELLRGPGGERCLCRRHRQPPHGGHPGAGFPVCVVQRTGDGADVPGLRRRLRVGVGLGPGSARTTPHRRGRRHRRRPPGPRPRPRSPARRCTPRGAPIGRSLPGRSRSACACRW
jgi:hypothetical protein